MVDYYDLLLLDTQAKIKSVFNKYNINEILISNSGGKDSEVMRHLLISTLNNINLKFIFFDTGIEYLATKEFIKKKQLEGNNISIIKSFKPVPLIIKQYGQPFLSKSISDNLERLQRHNFNFQLHGNKSYEELQKMYPKCLRALKWWCNWYGSSNDTNLKNRIDYNEPKKSSFNIARNIYLKEFLIKFGLPFQVSAKCCYYAKKMTSHNYEKKNNIKLNIIGIRKSEGGLRSRTYKSCFIERKDTEVSNYFPLFFWKNEDITRYIKDNNIILSDCYEKYNLKRTGCVGCPFGINVNYERKIVKQYENNLSIAIENIFKDSYLWSKKFIEFKKEMKNFI